MHCIIAGPCTFLSRNVHPICFTPPSSHALSHRSTCRSTACLHTVAFTQCHSYIGPPPHAAGVPPMHKVLKKITHTHKYTQTHTHTHTHTSTCIHTHTHTQVHAYTHTHTHTHTHKYMHTHTHDYNIKLLIPLPVSLTLAITLLLLLHSRDALHGCPRVARLGISSIV